ncbi:hypothetical protein VHEMI07205 [[Torrubiella] hemipterigena]|uniref:SnoaL-like domain-containing protein n=1 Tax=[Torrubiella] hemipterigena TaxID=1531966 RepID=A0A0A1TL75_9HYPO|nr:hypothetical protein VHEMI07205 [[Torrubiella] hemipterigena]
MSGGYFPVYPQHDNLPDPEIRTFITNFYQTSDKKESDELWVSFFHSDADVTIGNDHGKSEQGIRELRARMWNVVADRKHIVYKVFPHRFQESSDEGSTEHELMLFGDVHVVTKDEQKLTLPWAAHAVLRKGSQPTDEWKFQKYRVYLQR